MRPVSTFAIAAALVVGSAVILAPVSEANAKKKDKAEAPAAAAAPAPRQLNISKTARPALVALEKAVKDKDEAAYGPALAAAQAASTQPDEKYFVASQRYQHARNLNDAAGQLAALEAVIESGGAQPNELASANFNIGIAAFQASNWQKAHDSFSRTVELRPADTDAMFNLALTKVKLKKEPEAFSLLQQTIAAHKAAGKPVPEAVYRNALQVAYSSRNPAAVALGREIMSAYPTAENWRNALVVFRDSARADEQANLDVLRLMRASKAITTNTEYYSMARSAADAGLPGEAKAVLDQGVAANVIRTTDDTYRLINTLASGKIAEDRASLAGLESRASSAPTGRLAYRTADAYLGYGEYGKAASLYRTALSKGGADVDSNLVNLHLGMALALSGDKAGAATAFKAVTGARAELAGLWIDWLARPAA